MDEAVEKVARIRKGSFIWLSYSTLLKNVVGFKPPIVTIQTLSTADIAIYLRSNFNFDGKNVDSREISEALVWCDNNGGMEPCH